MGFESSNSQNSETHPHVFTSPITECCARVPLKCAFSPSFRYLLKSVDQVIHSWEIILFQYVFAYSRIKIWQCISQIKLQHSQPLGIWIFVKLVFKFSTRQANQLFQSPTIGPFWTTNSPILPTLRKFKKGLYHWLHLLTVAFLCSWSWVSRHSQNKAFIIICILVNVLWFGICNLSLIHGNPNSPYQPLWWLFTPSCKQRHRARKQNILNISTLFRTTPSSSLLEQTHTNHAHCSGADFHEIVYPVEDRLVRNYTPCLGQRGWKPYLVQRHIPT